MNLRSDGNIDTSGGKHVAKDSNLQSTTGLRPRRERVGLAVVGANAAAAVKTIVSAEAAAGVCQIWIGQPPFLARRVEYICGNGSKNIHNMSRIIDCAHLSASSVGPCTTGARYT